LEELEWGTNIYKWGQDNSKNMAEEQELSYSDYGAFQDVYRGVGYGTAAKTAEAVMAIWETGKQYDNKFLNTRTLYGSVAVYKSGDIYYITYIADYYH